MNYISVAAIFVFLTATLLFGMSFHNVDLAVNMQYGAIDTSMTGLKQDKVTMYMNGMSGLFISSVMFIGGFSLSLLGDKRVMEKF